MKKKLLSCILACGIIFSFGVFSGSIGSSGSNSGSVTTKELPTIY